MSRTKPARCSAMYFVVALAFFSGAAHAGGDPGPTVTVAPDDVRLDDWSAAQLAAPIALRELHRTEAASAHLIRLATRESPHAHDRHDLTVVAIRGDTVLHLADRDVALRPGDSAFIPRGVFHWAENVGAGPALAFVVFSPAFDGKDRRPIDVISPARDR
ncbi:MAG: cupin domain-containing protein [Chromatiales bacterium]|nr:cupin domain-containing protein [Chromatiales bacterium]